MTWCLYIHFPIADLWTYLEIHCSTVHQPPMDQIYSFYSARRCTANFSDVTSMILSEGWIFCIWMLPTHHLMIKFYWSWTTSNFFVSHNSEERHSRLMKSIFGDFIKRQFPGNLQWFPFTLETQNFYEIDSGLFGRNYLNSRAYTFWERYVPSLVEQVDEINGTYYSKIHFPAVSTTHVKCSSTRSLKALLHYSN